MSAVLFGQGYSLRLDPKLLAARQPYAPLGTLYAAAAARAAGHEVALHDSMLASSAREWEDALGRVRPRYAVLYEDSFNYLAKMSLQRARESAVSMIGAARRRGVTVLAAGPDASACAEPYLEAGAAAVIAGEGEAALVEALDVLDSRTASTLAEVRGLILREGRTPPRPPLRDLDGLPSPAWDLVDVEAYRRVWKAQHGYFSMNALTTRGCPYRCNWCATPAQGRTYATRSAASVAQELARVKRLYAPDHITFVDDIFGLKPGWVAELADQLSAHGAVIPFKCLSRADRLDDETVAALARAGCRTVWLGAESGSQKILDAMDKGTRVEDIRAASRRLRAHGIEVGFFLLFGYPGEGWEEIDETRALVKECQPDDIGVSVAYPLPGTRFHDTVAAQLGAQRRWVDSADLAMMYEGPFTTAFYRALHRVVHAELRQPRRRGWRRWLGAAALPVARWHLRSLA